MRVRLPYLNPKSVNSKDKGEVYTHFNYRYLVDIKRCANIAFAIR